MFAIRPGRRLQAGGFVLLAVLLIAAVGLLAVAGLAAATLAATGISGDDAAAARAGDAAEAGVADALERLRWGWVPPAGGDSAAFGPVATADDACYSGTVERLTAGPVPALDPSSVLSPSDSGIARYRLIVAGSSSHATRTISIVAVATPDRLPRGVVVAGDVTVAAPLRLAGCGLYAGGDVSGREQVTLTSPPASAADTPPDLAYAGLYAVAGVHARGRVLIAGADEHAGGAPPPADSDIDAGLVPPSELVGEPGAELLGDLGAHASSAQPALGPDGLDLSLLDAAAPPIVGDPALPAGGRVYVVGGAPGAPPTTLFGTRPPIPQACPLTLVVLGDCAVSAGPDADRPVSLAGALVVTGSLTIDAPLTVAGGVFAGRLAVRASVNVAFPAADGVQPPGMADLHIASWTE